MVFYNFLDLFEDVPAPR